MKVLILFSGTRSFEKVLEKMENIDVRGLYNGLVGLKKN